MWQMPRRWQPEVMDRPGLDSGLHGQALRGLARINRVSRTVRIVGSTIEELAERQGGAPLRVLDVATGAGDIPIGLGEWGRRWGRRLRIDACDISPTALRHARSEAARRQVKVRFFQCDALSGGWGADYDMIFCCLFLHHLQEEQAVGVLRRMAATAHRVVLIDDLVRSRAGLMLAHVATRLLSRSPVVWTDGPRSVRSAFTVQEAVRLADRAGLSSLAVRRHWPYRFSLTWVRTDG